MHFKGYLQAALHVGREYLLAGDAARLTFAADDAEVQRQELATPVGGDEHVALGKHGGPLPLKGNPPVIGPLPL
jgi:hypothetical protein